jgi:hypothetical protein
MLAKEMADLRDYMLGNGIIFCFSGFMNEDVLTGLSGALKKKLEVESTDRKTIKGMFSVFVEMVQNIIRYSAERADGPLAAGQADIYDLRYGVLTVGRDRRNRFFVSCGNLISNKDASRLEKDLRHINSLDREALMTLYKKALRGPPPDGSRGAGVGFIEIARHVGHDFEYDISAIDDDHSFFSLKAFI